METPNTGMIAEKKLICIIPAIHSICAEYMYMGNYSRTVAVLRLHKFVYHGYVLVLRARCSAASRLWAYCISGIRVCVTNALDYRGSCRLETAYGYFQRRSLLFILYCVVLRATRNPPSTIMYVYYDFILARPKGQRSWGEVRATIADRHQ